MTPGQVLYDRYEVVKTIGRGGSGAVYLCQDRRLPGQLWAVKELAPGELEGRFEEEAAILAGLRHPNLPMIIDYFTQADRQYLVMEFVEGVTLQRHVAERGPVDEVQALKWGLSAANVLAYLHGQAQPILFRDLKPDNIMLCEDGSLKLIDFGLAMRLTRESVSDSQAAGSVGYAPPEQWEEGAHQTERSDVYALGATLYFLLTGRPPSPVRGRNSLDGVRLTPRTRSLVERCMETNPEARWQRASDVVREMAGVLEELSPRRRGEAAAAHRRTPSYIPVLLGLATLLFCLGGILGLRGPATRPSEPRIEGSAGTKAQARRLMDERRYAEAAQLLDRLVTRTPFDPEAHILKQNTYARLLGGPVTELPVITSVTGVDASNGAQLLAGVALAQRDVNTAGAPSLVVEVLDSGSDPGTAVRHLEELVRRPEALAVLGPLSSEEFLAMAPVANREQFPVITSTATDPRVFDAGPYVFSLADSQLERLRAVARKLVQLGLKRGVMVVDREVTLSETMRRVVSRELEDLGASFASVVSYDESTADFSAVAAQVARAQPDFVFIADYRPPITAAIARALRAAGVTVQLAGQSVAYNPELPAQGGSAVEGILLSTYLPENLDDPRMGPFVKEYRASFDLDYPSHITANTYDASRLLSEILAEATSREQVRDVIESLGHGRPAYEGVVGSYAPRGGQSERRAYIITVKDGRYEVLPEG